MNAHDFILDKDSRTKLYHQLYSLIVDAIEKGTLSPDEKLESVRNMSQILECSKNTITRAYADLEKEGYIYSKEKSGYFVNSNRNNSAKDTDSVSEKKAIHISSSETLSHKADTSTQIPTVDKIMHKANSDFFSFTNDIPVSRTPSLSESVYSPRDLLPIVSYDNVHKTVIVGEGEVIEESIEQSLTNVRKIQAFEKELAESYRTVLTTKSNQLYKSIPFSGDETFKIALSAFLYKFHNIDVNPKRIVVSSSFDLLMETILSLPSIQLTNINSSEFQGNGLLQKAEMYNSKLTSIKPTIAINESSDLKIQQLFIRKNIPVKLLPTDDSGVLSDYLVTSGATLLFVSPRDIPAVETSPFSDLSERVAEFYEWAAGANYRYIIEYDTETSPDILTNIKTLDSTEKVIYLNSFKHLLCNGINASFAILPKNLISEYNDFHGEKECPLSYLDQLALTDFIVKGKLLNYLNNIGSLSEA